MSEEKTTYQLTEDEIGAIARQAVESYIQSQPKEPEASVSVSDQPLEESPVVTIIYQPNMDLQSGGFQAAKGADPLGSLTIGVPIPEKKEHPLFRDLQLASGVNREVDRPLWEQAKQQPLTQERLRRGAIREIYPESTNNLRPDSLKGYRTDSAKAMIEAERSVDRLKQWRRDVQSERLLEQIDRRIQGIQQGTL